MFRGSCPVSAHPHETLALLVTCSRAHWRPRRRTHKERIPRRGAERPISTMWVGEQSGVRQLRSSVQGVLVEPGWRVVYFRSGSHRDLAKRATCTVLRQRELRLSCVTVRTTTDRDAHTVTPAPRALVRPQTAFDSVRTRHRRFRKVSALVCRNYAFHVSTTGLQNVFVSLGQAPRTMTGVSKWPKSGLRTPLWPDRMSAQRGQASEHHNLRDGVNVKGVLRARHERRVVAPRRRLPHQR